MKEPCLNKEITAKNSLLIFHIAKPQPIFTKDNVRQTKMQNYHTKNAHFSQNRLVWQKITIYHCQSSPELLQRLFYNCLFPTVYLLATLCLYVLNYNPHHSNTAKSHVRGYGIYAVIGRYRCSCCAQGGKRQSGHNTIAGQTGHVCHPFRLQDFVY